MYSRGFFYQILFDIGQHIDKTAERIQRELQRWSRKFGLEESDLSTRLRDEELINEVESQGPVPGAAGSDSKPQESNLWEPPTDELACNEVEVQGSGPEAAESGIAWKACRKNPGHPKFIPVSEFGLNNLPLKNQTQEILSYIRDLSDITVRLRVTCTSWERPDGDQFSTLRGKNLARLGTGWVSDVFIGDGPCPCKACLDSPMPYQEWYRIWVKTACHVVYNEEEAESTTVDFMFDDTKAKKEGRATTVSGVGRFMYRNGEYDDCMFTCFTHGTQLGARLKEAEGRVSRPRFHEYRLDDVNGNPELRDTSLAVVVSHPHGQPKQITLGDWLGIKRRVRDGEESWSKRLFTSGYSEYRSDTCPGSSGAPVVVFGPNSECSNLTRHSGSNREDKLNYSAANVSMRVPGGLF